MGVAFWGVSALFTLVQAEPPAAPAAWEAEIRRGIMEAVAAAFPTATGGPGFSRETAWRLGAETECDEAMLRALLPQDYQDLDIALHEAENGRTYFVLAYRLMREWQLHDRELWVDVHDSLARYATAMRAVLAAVEQSPRGITDLQDELWGVYRQCCLKEGAVDIAPLCERISQLQEPSQVYLTAVFFMECMPKTIPEPMALLECYRDEELEALSERVSCLWSHRDGILWACKETLILMAREGNEQALQYAARLVRDYPGNNSFDLMYQRETEKLLRGEVSDSPLTPEV